MFPTILAILTVLLFRAGVMTFTCLLFCVGFVIFVVVTYVVLLQAGESAQSARVWAVVMFPTILAILSGLLFRADYLTFAGSLFFAGFVSVVAVTYVVLLQSDSSYSQSAAIFAAVIIPTILAILSGLMILVGFLYWGVIMFLVSVVLFILFTAAVVGFPSEPSKALGAWALLLILVVLMFLTILLFQAGHGTVAVLLLLVGIVTVVFTSASSGVSKNPPSFDKFKLGVQGAWAPITMAVVAMAFEFVIYPVICPILTVESSRHHTILLWALIVETFSGTMVFSLTGINKDIIRLWNSGPQRFYHLLWLMFIPYFGLGLASVWALHHPSSGFSRRLKFGAWGGIFTCLFYLSAENLVNIGFGCPWGHAFTGAGGLYRKYVQLGKGDESKLKNLIGELVDGTGGLKELGSADKVTEALGKSGLSEKHKNVYANAFKVVFNKVRTYDPTGGDLEQSGKLKDSAKEKIKGKIENVFTAEAGLNDFSSDQQAEFKSACANAYFNAYNTAVEVDSGLSIGTEEDQIKEELNKALSSKSLQLSAAQVAAYAKAAFAKQSADETAKKAGRRAVGVVAAAELAGCLAVSKKYGGPQDIPASPDPSKAAGYVMNFTNCLTNSFGVLTGFLIKAHLANYLNCSRKLAEGHVFPTASMNGFRSCWFWFSCASSGAWKNFISMFSLDIKEMLLS
ncbi:uncharacterized protein BdWA1_003485 [Babesia duncani]|nr:hypothetical protein BdWA1_003570 [Babesia duncani]KAK2195030.1 hypothetical protein BdWA1_003496 [Babesia duncani]KAK2195037.1 hypothetical protein BdWA1_003485 [Babesia duncani]